VRVHAVLILGRRVDEIVSKTEHRRKFIAHFIIEIGIAAALIKFAPGASRRSYGARRFNLQACWWLVRRSGPRQLVRLRWAVVRDITSWRVSQDIPIDQRSCCTGPDL
jgi:hypothetical protein